jgi:hypothetical protein
MTPALPVRGSLIAASTAVPARCTIGPIDGGSRQCHLVIALLTAQKASRDSIGSPLKPTPTGQDAWRAASHSCDECSNACGHAARNQAASRMALTAPWTILATDLAPALSSTQMPSLLIVQTEASNLARSVQSVTEV